MELIEKLLEPEEIKQEISLDEKLIEKIKQDRQEINDIIL